MKKTLRNYLLNIPPPEGDLTQLQLDVIEKAVREYLVGQSSEGFSSEKSSSLLVAEKEASLRKLFNALYKKIGEYSVDSASKKEMLHFNVLGVMLDEILKEVFSAGFPSGKSAELLGEEK